MAPLFPDFRKIRKRMKRSLNYGTKQPSSLNFPLSELVVAYFNKQCTFDYMEPETSTSISKQGYADPCTLVVALVYLDRLRTQNKKFFESTDPTSLYLPALILASKYLHDADTYDRVSNSEWAESLKLEPDDVNNMEWNLVKELDWNVALKNEEFEKCLSTIETWVAGSFVEKNGFTTYNELFQLSSTIPIYEMFKQLVEFFSGASIIYCLTLAMMTAAVQNPIVKSTSENLTVPEGGDLIYQSYPASWIQQANGNGRDGNNDSTPSLPEDESNNNLIILSQKQKNSKPESHHKICLFKFREEPDFFEDIIPNNFDNLLAPYISSCPSIKPHHHQPNFGSILSF